MAFAEKWSAEEEVVFREAMDKYCEDSTADRFLATLEGYGMRRTDRALYSHAKRLGYPGNPLLTALQQHIYKNNEKAPAQPINLAPTDWMSEKDILKHLQEGYKKRGAQFLKRQVRFGAVESKKFRGSFRYRVKGNGVAALPAAPARQQPVVPARKTLDATPHFDKKKAWLKLGVELGEITKEQAFDLLVK